MPIAIAVVTATIAAFVATTIIIFPALLSFALFVVAKYSTSAVTKEAC